MDTVKRIAKNSFITISAKAISILPSLIILSLVARYLSRDLFGEYIFIIAFVTIFEVFTDMGYNSILVREISRAKDQLRKLIGTAIIAKFFIALLTFILIVISANVLALIIQLTPVVKKAIYILGFAVCMDFFTDIVISTVRAHEQMEYEASIITFNSILSLLLIATVVFLDLGFIYLFWSRLYSSAFTMGLSLFIYTKKFGSLHVHQDRELGKYLVQESLPLGVGQVIDRFYSKTNFILIRTIRSVTEVGFYGGAYRIVEQLSLIAVSIVTAVFPVFSLLSQSSRSSLALAHEKTLKVLTIISLPIVVILSCLSEKITVIVFGSNLIEIAQPLKVLSFVVFFSFSSLLFKFTLSAINKQTIYRKNVLISFFVNLLMALLLIPRYGYMGACAVALVSSGFLFMLGHYSIRKHLPGVSLLTALIKPVIGSLVMALVVILMRHMNVFVVGLSGIIVYVLTLIVLKTVTSDEINTLKRTTIPIQGE